MIQVSCIKGSNLVPRHEDEDRPPVVRRVNHSIETQVGMMIFFTDVEDENKVFLASILDTTADVITVHVFDRIEPAIALWPTYMQDNEIVVVGVSVGASQVGRSPIVKRIHHQHIIPIPPFHLTKRNFVPKGIKTKLLYMGICFV